MLKQLQQRYHVLQRVRDFGARHQNDFPATSVAVKAFAIVAQVVAAIEYQSSERLVNAQAGKKARAAARAPLVDRINAIARAALEAGASELPAPDGFRFPSRRSDAALIEAANTFIKYGPADSARWVPFGLPETSIEELRQMLDAFVKAIGSRREGQAGVKAAQKAIADAFREGRAAVRQLDVLVANTYKADTAIATAWKDLRRVGPVSRRPKTAPATGAPRVAAQ